MQELTANDAKLLSVDATEAAVPKYKAVKRGLAIQRMRNKEASKSAAFRKRTEKRRAAAALRKKSRKANIQRQKS